MDESPTFCNPIELGFWLNHRRAHQWKWMKRMNGIERPRQKFALNPKEFVIFIGMEGQGIRIFPSIHYQVRNDIKDTIGNLQKRCSHERNYHNHSNQAVHRDRRSYSRSYYLHRYYYYRLKERHCHLWLRFRERIATSSHPCNTFRSSSSSVDEKVEEGTVVGTPHHNRHPRDTAPSFHLHHWCDNPSCLALRFPCTRC